MFSPCGSTITSGSRDRSIRLWNAGTGALKDTLQGFDIQMLSLFGASPIGPSPSIDMAAKAVAHTMKSTILLWLRFSPHYPGPQNPTLSA